jgi:hypothetical protein
MSIKNFLILVPVAIYYMIESFFLALIVQTVWFYFLQDRFKFELTYMNWFAIIFIIKLILYDVFKATYTIINANNNQEKKES